MNIQFWRKGLFVRAHCVIAVMAAVWAAPLLRAQPTEQTVDNRFLFIFDTSAEMKPRLDATEMALKTMLVTSMGGRLHSGDSMGVWTFNEDLQTGQYPLLIWNADNAATITSNLLVFVGRQHFTKSTRLESLQPLLNQVMQGSERLSVFVFCDGEGKVTGTPFDAAINQLLAQKSAEQKKARQPFIILLRSQLGTYIGCTVTLSPLPVNYPQFPPLPAPPTPPAPKPVYVPPPAPVVMAPPLFITGTNVSNHLPVPVTIPPPPPPMTNPIVIPPPSAPSVLTVPPTNLPAPPATNPVAARISLPPPGNPPPALTDTFDVKNAWLIGGGTLFGVAIILGLFFRGGTRHRDASLITRSMNDLK